MEKRGFDLADGLSETKCKLDSNIKGKKKKQQLQGLQQVKLLRRQMDMMEGHMKDSKKKTNSGSICKQLTVLCCYHAKHCQGTKCLIKHKIKRLQRLQRVQLLKKRMDVMNKRPTRSVATQTGQQTANVLQNQGQDKFIYTCNNCKSYVETRYHCTVCDDFDLCVSCKDKDGHQHPVEKLCFDLDGLSLADAKQTNPQEARKLSIQRCIQSLIHVCQCSDANCSLPNCRKMKRVVMHTKNCKRNTKGGCPICKQLIALCCLHAKHCQETKCLVPFCSNIKRTMKQQQQ